MTKQRDERLAALDRRVFGKLWKNERKVEADAKKEERRFLRRGLRLLEFFRKGPC